MNQRDLEDAGQRFYEVKGRMNGEDRDESDAEGICAECYEGCPECSPEDPTDTLQPWEVYPSELDEAEGELLEHLDDLYDPDL